MRQIQEKPVLCDSVRPCSVCLAYIIRLYNGLLYAHASGYRKSLYPYNPTYGGAVSDTDPIHKGMNQIHNPDTKSVSIDTSGNVVNLPDCTDLCNRFKIERVSMPSKLSVFQLRPFAWSA